MTSNNNPCHFQEVQRFNRVGLIIMILGISGFMLFGTIQEILYGKETGSDPNTHLGIIILGLLVSFGVPAFFFSIKLITEVRSDGVYLKFFPLQLKYFKIPFNELLSYQVRQFKPILEYGGWGIRWGSRGKAYTISGNYGVQFELKNGKEILIGSKKSQDLVLAIESAQSNFKY